jgi:hypothetical protein
MVTPPPVAVTDQGHPASRIAEAASVDEEERAAVLDATPKRGAEEDGKAIPNAHRGIGERERQPRRPKAGSEWVEERHLPRDAGVDMNDDVGSGHGCTASSGTATFHRAGGRA